MRRVPVEDSFASVLVKDWITKKNLEGPKPTALGTRIRHSDAAKCARALALTAMGVPGEGMDAAGVWVTTIGTLLHEAWQESLQRRFPGAEVEVKVRTDGADASGHLDARIVHRGRRITYELKTTGGTSFRRIVGAPNGRQTNPAEGPKWEHTCQGALNAAADNADELRIGYLALEAVAKGREGFDGLERFMAEFAWERHEFEPIAREERTRMAGILRLLDEGVVAATMWPEGPGKVVHLKTTGRQFPCGYCPHRYTCVGLGPDRVSTVAVTALTGVPA